MRIALVIMMKEIKSYFFSPIAYVVLTGFSAISGFLFYQLLQLFIRVSSTYRGYMLGGEIVREWTLVDDVMAPFYRNLALFFIVMVPAITMRLFAEEKKLKTEELLLTSPIRTGSVVIGKYVSALVVLFLMLMPGLIYLAIVFLYSTTIDRGPVISGYLGLYILAMALAGIGIFASTLSENQIVAFIVAVIINLFFFTIGLASGTVESVNFFGREVNLGFVLKELSLYEHFYPFTEGRILITDVLYFFLLGGWFLFSARLSAESARGG